MLAYSFPLFGIFVSLLFLFIWIVWLVLLFRVVSDVFRSEDLGGWGKAAWLVLVIALPYLGVLVYTIVRGAGMTQRDLERMQASETAVQGYIRSTVAGPSGTADELAKLADLQAKGVLSDAEFQAQKAKLLA
jgi:hypothetical protein